MIQFIIEEKVGGYLKLKKALALYVGIGEYFESKTFDWVKLSMNNVGLIDAKLLDHLTKVV